MSVYLDTSAVAKLLVAEPESSALVAVLDDLRARGESLVSSALLETELRRLAGRVGVPQAAASAVLARIALADPDRALFTAAGLLPGAALRSLDALHVATALRLQVTTVVTYDERQAAAAEEVGLVVLAPR